MFRNLREHWRLTLLPLGVGFGLLLAVVGITTWLGVLMNNGKLSVIRTIDIDLHLSELFSELQDAETGQRGYLLTGDPAYLEPYDNAVKRIDAEFKKLNVLIAKDSASLHKLQEIRQVIDEKLEELNATIEARRAGQHDRALGLVREGTGKHLMDRARDLIHALKDQRGEVLLAQQNMVDRARYWTQIGVTAAFVLLMATAAMTGAQLRRQWAQADAAHKAVEATNHRLIEAAVRREQLERGIRDTEDRLKSMQIVAATADRQNLLSGMVSALAHEINQPLTAARAVARTTHEILRTGTFEVGAVQQDMHSLVAQIDHAANVVRTIRELIRRGPTEVAEFSLRDVINDALTLARAGALMHGIDVSQSISSELPKIRGDRVQIQQIILNLVRNAAESIRATARTNGEIRISALQRDQSIEVGVLDNGEGVQSELKLFEPFMSTKPEGLGLGLSICSAIVQSHGGRIWFKSTQAGATEICFSIPLNAGRYVGGVQIADRRPAAV